MQHLLQHLLLLLLAPLLLLLLQLQHQHQPASNYLLKTKKPLQSGFFMSPLQITLSVARPAR
jgi:hypothetical protein